MIEAGRPFGSQAVIREGKAKLLEDVKGRVFACPSPLNAGHMAHWSAPAALAERLIAFFGGEREATAGGGRDEAVANGESAGGEETAAAASAGTPITLKSQNNHRALIPLRRSRAR
jgi:hypothetical protein